MDTHEMTDKLAEIENEYGRLPVVIPDALEPGWITKVSSVEFDHDRQVVVVSCD